MSHLEVNSKLQLSREEMQLLGNRSQDTQTLPQKIGTLGTYRW